ncbi:hypothetical protein G3N58_22935 [Paraburkholderia sp. Ac-20342]|uniref:hypothetical protein n=1 Tax=Paraburkholderia sp. Ac-20342 TaxID=2703889 RepID=UPI0019800BD4|nr:hypothetical protein [Paraburkholderia sp. Ac-20342]MBN3849661.1 hypothetical protein [Paraburkholderia sp. Ac-20342]
MFAHRVLPIASAWWVRAKAARERRSAKYGTKHGKTHGKKHGPKRDVQSTMENGAPLTAWRAILLSIES